MSGHLLKHYSTSACKNAQPFYNLVLPRNTWHQSACKNAQPSINFGLPNMTCPTRGRFNEPKLKNLKTFKVTTGVLTDLVIPGLNQNSETQFINMVRGNNHFTRKSRVRKANFVLNNPSAADRAWLASLSAQPSRLMVNIRFIVFQEELGLQQQTPHIQGYIEWVSARYPLGAQMNSDGSPYRRMHFTPVDNPRAAIAYAKKDRTRVEGGLHGEYGLAAANRTQTVSDVTEQILSGTNLKQVLEEHPDISFMHYEKIVDFHNRQVKDRDACNVTLLIGPSGCGKSWWADKTAKSKGTTYYVPDRTRHNGRWDWKSYSSQNSIIINEFDDKWLKVVSFKQFFDIFPFQVEAKGQNMSLKTNNIYLTTNNDIKNWYSKFRSSPENAVHTAAMERRITQFFKIYDCRRNTNWMAPTEEQGETLPFMQMVLRPHPVGGFKFGELQSSFAYIPTVIPFNDQPQDNRDGLSAYGQFDSGY